MLTCYTLTSKHLSHHKLPRFLLIPPQNTFSFLCSFSEQTSMELLFCVKNQAKGIKIAKEHCLSYIVYSLEEEKQKSGYGII